MLPDNLSGKDAIELGSGTAYVSAWMASRGARVVGIDNSSAQLATARRLQQQHGLEFPLLHGNAEASRLFHPGGQLVFLTNSFLMALCTPDDADVAATDRLQRPAHGMYRLQGPSEHGFVTREWARQWPSEEVWKLRKRG